MDSSGGGAGNDVLRGDAGADRFVIAGGGRDVIKDFQPGQDVIDLSVAFDSLSAVRAAATLTGRAVVIDLGVGTLRIAGFDLDDLGSDCFLL
ncbi:M10 family metallopeptidase C-terminal domain-containing protein [uncultured Paracoccus sp.]|uniref:M10 family metallopeptidase C-terminal domain-containing protein n=1 Tax=uncultured Paracoccus sp. TaxID=189685 RepID=UPI0026169721|nr:M10 family metallopeptidase C-terminal domain-containing protein [uncultured Paracoccus sp.]